MSREYSDVSIFGRRTYRIVDGILTANGTEIGKAKFEVTIELRTLNPNFDRLWLWSPLLPPMSFVALLGIVGSMVLGEFSQKPGISWVHGLCLTMGFAGILFSVFSLRRIPAARFKNSAGVGVLDIFAAGPRRKEFAAFIAELQSSIRNAQKG